MQPFPTGEAARQPTPGGCSYADTRSWSHSLRPAIGMRITRSSRTLNRGSKPGRARHLRWRAPAVPAALFREAVARRLVQGVGGPEHVDRFVPAIGHAE